MRCARLLACAAVLLAGCSPVLDWREVQPEGAFAQLMFPCKPATHVRTLELAGARVPLSLHACTAGQMTFALAAADVGEVARVGPALQQLREAAHANLGGVVQAMAIPRVDGMTPQPATQRMLVRGQRPDGTAVVEDVFVFSRGTRVYQASVLGVSLEAEPVETFLGSIKLRS